MRTLIKMKLIPGFLTTTLFALACEKPPNPAAPKRAQFSMQDDNNSRITGGGKLDGGRDFCHIRLERAPRSGPYRVGAALPRRRNRRGDVLTRQFHVSRVDHQ